MNDKLIRPLNREIAALLAARPDCTLSGRKVSQALSGTPGWSQGLSALLPIRERLDCSRVLDRRLSRRAS